MTTIRQSKFVRNHKGMTSFVMKLIIMVILILISVVIISKTLKSFNKGTDCVNNGGVCTSNECNMFTQISIMGDTAAGCKSGEKCCRSIIKPKPPHTKCSGKPVGTTCGTSMYCDEGSQCVNKCEFCSKNFGVKSEKDTQNTLCFVTNGTTTFEQLKDASDGKPISCSCTDAECKQGDTNCVRDVCIGKDEKYVCCFKSP
jgi:hypothetical protein